MSKAREAKTIINTHKNPVIHRLSFGKKVFIPENTEVEIELVNNALETLKNVLSEERVEKRSARATAEWIPELKRAKIIKRIGHVTQFGYKKDKNFWLLPEETLFLLELNRLELTYNETPFSIEQAYKTLLGKDTCSIKQYRIYQNLALNGFYIKNTKEQVETCESSNMDDMSSAKKVKIEETESKDRNYCYNIYSSESTHKKLTHKLQLQSNNATLNNDNISTSEFSVLTCFSENDSVAFYQLQAIDFDNK